MAVEIESPVWLVSEDQSSGCSAGGRRQGGTVESNDRKRCIRPVRDPRMLRDASVKCIVLVLNTAHLKHPHERSSPSQLGSRTGRFSPYCQLSGASCHTKSRPGRCQTSNRAVSLGHTSNCQVGGQVCPSTGRDGKHGVRLPVEIQIKRRSLQAPHTSFLSSISSRGARGPMLLTRHVQHDAKTSPSPRHESINPATIVSPSVLLNHMARNAKRVDSLEELRRLFTKLGSVNPWTLLRLLHHHRSGSRESTSYV